MAGLLAELDGAIMAQEDWMVEEEGGELRWDALSGDRGVAGALLVL